MRGDTLIEVLVALTVAIVMISAITSLGIVSLNNTQFINDQDEAGKYAQQGMEVVRQIRNSSYTGFRTYRGTYCLRANATTLTAGTCNLPNINGRYIRSVVIQQNAGCGGGANIANVAVSVSWTDGKCQSGVYCHASKLTSCFSTVSPIPAP